MSVDPGLANAVEVLEFLAAGTAPDRVRILSGALALSTLCARGTPDQDLLDAAAALDDLATGRELQLNTWGRARAAKLAARVRREKFSPAP